MCGITGYLNLDGAPASQAIVGRMTDALAHRGPDGEGFYVDGPLAFGHRRLSIIDLTDGGSQPMQTGDGRYVITYNGELYNFQELRVELQARGRKFRSRSDTEVVLTAWAEWGPAALDRFNGMFAFAIWDRSERRLHLARDRFGVKPLYYAIRNGRIAFGSECKAVTAGGLAASLDLEALLEYMTFQNLFTDRTLLDGIRLLPPGQRLEADFASGEVKQAEYWDFDFSEGTAEAGPATVDELDGLFQQAVNRQLVSDVEVGSFLSGGIDSGSIAAVASKQMPLLRTFTVGFDMHSASGVELAYDERVKAEHMSYLFGTEHYEMVLKAGDMQRAIPAIVHHLEEPRVGQSYPNYYAARLASRFGKVVLAGTGGDELFGGYPWRYYRAVVNTDFEDYVDKYYLFWQRLLPNTELKRVFAPVWDKVKHVWTRDIFRDVFHKHADKLTRPEDYVNHSLYFEAKTFLHGLLVVEDKLAMAHGLEARVPFLDNDLVAFAQKLPVAMKLGNLGEVVRLDENAPGNKTAVYFEQTKDGKLLLRQALQRHVPQQVHDGAKQGFSAPDATWFRGESIDYVRRRIHDDKSPLWDVFDRKAVRELIDQHLEAKQNRRLLIWSLLYLDQWLRSPELAIESH